MKKKLIPIALASILLAGCPSPEEPSSGNALVDLLSSIEVGSVKKKTVDKIFKAEVLKSSDRDVKSASYREILYSPYWQYVEGQEESFYSENVKRSDRTRSYKVYDNSVIECSDTSEVYPYKKALIDKDPEGDGISSKAVQYKGDAVIWHDEEEEQLRYVYTRDDDKKNYFSFEAHADFDDYLFDDCIHDGGLSHLISQAKEDVEDTFSYYAAAWNDTTREQTYVAEKKEDGSFHVFFQGDLCMDLYSAEYVWGYEFDKDDEGEYDYDKPIRKETDEWDDIYVDRRIRFAYEFTIDSRGFVTSGFAKYFSYHTSLLLDTWHEYANRPWFVEGGVLNRGLDKEVIRALKTPGRLVVPETLPAYGENPYAAADYEYDERLPYNIDYFATSGDSNGNFAPENLPDPDEYRAQFDMIDVGVWIDAYELFMEEH